MLIQESSLLLQSDHQLIQKHQIHESLVEGVSAPGERWSPESLSEGVVFERTQSREQRQVDQESLFEQVQALGSDGFVPDNPISAGQLDALRERLLDNGGSLPGPVVNLSDLDISNPPIVATEAKSAQDIAEGFLEELDALLIKSLFEWLTGKKFQIVNVDDVKANVDTDLAENSSEVAAEAGDLPAELSGWGLHYQYHETYKEVERTSFSATGLVKTADGKEIEIEVSLNMSRRYSEEKHVDIQMGAAVVKDPLVLNFSGTAAQLTQTKFEFDIDMDGEQEKIAFVKPGSGLLALDKNGDGSINDGSELFGPTTGDGFDELSVYDTDANQWIDEADDVYARLQVWLKDEQGNDQLIALGQAGVGAIYLGRTQTTFSLTDAENNLQAQIGSTGVFLGEEGGVGTIQQIDFVV